MCKGTVAGRRMAKKTQTLTYNGKSREKMRRGNKEELEKETGTRICLGVYLKSREGKPLKFYFKN